MKKSFVVTMSALLVLALSLTACANSSASKKAVIELDISTSEEDQAFIREYQKTGDDNYSKENNHIVMNVTDIRESGDKAIISGDAAAKMFGESYTFSFEEQELDMKFVKDKKLYTGAFEVAIDDRYSGIVDMTATETFGKAIISFTLLDLENENNQQIMLYGDTFEEQVELFHQELENAKKTAG